MKLTSATGFAAARTPGWMKRALQAAVLVAISASVPVALGAGGAGGAGGAASLKINNIAAGSATISQAGNVTTIRTGSANTIINYQSFSVMAGHTLNFAQPTAASRVLNRIQGNDPSQINGTILSNGIVYLVNPAGITFGNGAVVNVGQFYAAGAHMSDQDFLRGNNHFTDAAGKVVNQGNITAGQVHLLGGQVINEGVIVAGGDGSTGIVTITSGKDIYIGEVDSPGASPVITVKIAGGATNATAAGGAGGVKNSGSVNALGGQIQLGAGDVYGVALANTGSLKGSSISLQGGTGVVIAGGTIDASSATGAGGTVHVLGSNVAVTGTINASGAAGGGAVRIGGDFHGAGALQTSTNTLVTATAKITADATTSGNGGTVAVWSNNNTWFDGSISAKGAGLGDGGQAEVSGHNLSFTGAVDLTAPDGATGTLLLDPVTLNIVATGNAGDDALLVTDLGVITAGTAPSGSEPMAISASAIVTQLSTTVVSLAASSTINVETTITGPGAGNKLTLTAPNINIFSGVSVTTGNGDLEFAGAVSFGGGTSNISAGNGALTFDNAITDSGATTVNMTGDTVTLGGTLNIGGPLAVTSSSAATNLTIANNITAAAVTLSSNDSIINNAAINTATANGNVALASAGITLSGGTIAAGAGTVTLLNINSANAINLGSGGGYQVAPADLASITSAAGIVIGQSGAESAVNANQFDASAVTIPITLNASSAAGTVTLNDGGAGTALAVGGNLTVNSGTGGIVAATATNAFAEISAGGAISLNSTGVIGSSASRIQFNSGQSGVSATATGDIFLNGLGNLSLGAVNSSTGTVDVTTAAASAGNISATGTLTGATISLNADGAIGLSSAVKLAPGGAVTLATSGLGAAGNIHVATNSANLDNFTFTTAGTGQTLTVDSAAALLINTSLDTGGDNLVIHADTAGTFGAGALTFTNGITITAPAITFQAGIGDGSLSASSIVFPASLTLATTTSLAVRQDASMSASFNGSALTNYTLQSDGGNVTVSNAGNVAGTHLTLTAGTGAVNINTNLTGGNSLASLVTNGAANVGANITTTGNQSYNNAVVLTGDATLTGVDINFAGTLDGGHTLNVNASGATTFGGAVGGATPLTNLSTDAPGTAAINGGAVTTTGQQNYSDPVTLGAATTLTSNSSGAISFGGTLDGGQTLVVNTSGATSFNGAVGGGAPLTSLTTDAGGTTAIGGGAITTTGLQSYNDALTLGAATTLTSNSSGAITLGATVNGGQTLAINTSGATTFSGAVGGTTPLTSITTDAAGITALNGGAITTTGLQLFNDAVTLGAATTLASNSSGAITFAGTLNGGQTLAINTAGATTFSGAVGGTTPLTSITTNAAGTTALNGGAITTTGLQLYNDPVTLGAAATLTSNSSGAITFAGTLDGGQTLAVNTSGTTTFSSAVGGATPLTSLTTNSGGTTAINGGTITTTGLQAYNDAVTLGAATTLASNSSGNISFGGALNGGQTLAVNTTGTTSFSGTVGGTTPLTSITTNVGGTTSLNGAITTTGQQSYGDAVTLGAATTLTSNSSGAINFISTIDGGQTLAINTSGILTFFGAVGGAAPLTSLTTNATGSTVFSGGAVTTTGLQNYNNPVSLGGATTLTSNASGAITFGGTINGGQILAINTSGNTTFSGIVGGLTGPLSITTDAGGTTTISTTAITTQGAQTYNDAVAMVGANPTLTSNGSGNITFGSTLDGAHILTVNTAGNEIFDGKVGGITPLASLTTDAANLGGSVHFNYASSSPTDFSVTTAAPGGTQTYNDAVVLGANTILSSTASGNITFKSTVDGSTVGGQALTVNSGGDEIFEGNVGATALASLITDDPASGIGSVPGGTARINHADASTFAVTTAGLQTYNDAVVLGNSAALSTTTLKSLGGGNITFESTLQGAANHKQSLVVTTTGTVTNVGTVGGGGHNLASYATSGTTSLSGTVNADSVIYGVVVLTADTTLNVSSVDFSKTLDSVGATPFSLTVNSMTDTIFDGAVGNIHPLHNLTVNNVLTPGTIQFTSLTGLSGGIVTTTGTQSYNYPVLLGNNGGPTSHTFTSTGSGAAGQITFASTLDGPAGSAPTLTVSTAGGIQVTGPINVGDLAGTVTLTTSGANSAGNIHINITAANLDQLALTTDAGTVQTRTIDTTGALLVNSSINTAGDNLVIHADTAGTAGAGALTFTNGITITAPNITLWAGIGDGSLAADTITFPATLTLSGATSLTIRQDGSIADAGVNGAALGNYNLQSDGGNVAVSTAANVAGTNLTLTADTTGPGTVTISSAIAPASLISNGTTHLNADVTAATDQTYNGPVLLGAGVTLTGVNVDFTSTINGAQTLTVNASGATTFAGIIGGATPLTTLTTDAPGTTAINATAITTTGTQLFSDPVTLGADAVLATTTAANVSFVSTLDGAHNLTVNPVGIAVFGGVIGGTTPLTSLTTNAGAASINTTAITTTGAQNYNNPVVLASNVTLTSNSSGNIGFTSTLDGAQTLSVDTAGTTTFGGIVGGATPLTSITTDAPGTAQISTTAITTTGAQTYNDPVSLVGANPILTSTASGNIAFGSTLDGAHTLAINTSGTTEFSGIVGGATPLVSIATDAPGSTQINTSAISTTGAQNYNDPVSLTASATLASTGSGNISFGSTLNGGQNLAVNTSGTTTFTGIVGAITPLTSLTTDAGGATHVNGGAIDTTGAQNYNDPVTLGNDASFTASASGNVNFASTLDGPFLILVDTGGTTTFGGIVGGATPLSSITTDVGGTTAINTTAITTSGAQAFHDAVTLGANAALTSNASGNIAFFATLDGAHTLNVNTAGTTTFTGVLGGAAPLTSLTIGASGTTDINTSAITTVNAQAFGNPVVLGVSTILTTNAAGNVTFSSTINGAQSLTVNTAGVTTFQGAIGGATPLAAITTDAAGSTDLNGGTVVTTGLQLYSDPVLISANTILTSTGSGDITFGSSVDGSTTPGAFDLTVNTAGTTTFTGIVGGTVTLRSLTTDAPGTTVFLNNSFATTADQVFNDPVILTDDTVVNTGGTGSVFFNSTVDGAFNLTVFSAGVTHFNGIVGGTTPLTSLTVDAVGATTINTTAITTTNFQHFNNPVTLTQNAVLTSTGSGNITLAGTVNGAFSLNVNTAGVTTFGGAVGGVTPLSTLTTNAGGSTAINGGAVTTTGLQAYNDSVTLGADATLASTGSGNITFAGTVDGGFTLAVNTAGLTTFDAAVGGVTPITSLTTDAGGATDLNGASVLSTGLQAFNDPVVLTANTTLTSSGSGNVSFGSTLDGAFTLAVNTAGATTFSGPVGGSTALASVTTDAAGSTAVNGSAVTTTGLQTFNDPVTLGADTTLTSTGSGNISLASTVNGAFSLTIDTAGVTTLAGAIGGTTALTSITTDAPGTTSLNVGTISTTGAQTFNDPVTLGAPSVLTSTGSGAVTFGSAVDGAFALTVDTAGTTTFDGAVGGTAALASVTTDAPGTTAINGGTVITTGLQTFDDAVTLGAGTTLTSTGNSAIKLGSTVNGAFTLAINTTGTTTLGGAVGGTTALASLTTNAGGTTAINGGSVTTTGLQSFNDAVTLGANSALTSTGAGTIGFSSTINGAFTLAINTAGTTILAGAIGGTTPLTSLTTDAPGNTNLSAGSVNTTGAQTFNDPVVLGAAGTLASSGSGNITLASTVNGAFALTVNTSGLTTFGGLVGGGTPLASVTTNVGGGTAIDGGGVTTTGLQAYNDAVSLGANTVLASSGAGNISFATTVNGAFTLALNTTGTTTLGGIVGGSTSLASLTTNAGGTTALNGGAITTAGVQSFGDNVTLGAATTLTSSAGAAITFDGTVNGAQSLTVNTTGETGFLAAVGNTTPLASLSTNAGGFTDLNGAAVATVASQVFGDPVTLSANTTLTSSAGGAIAFASTVNGAFNLAVNTAGLTSFHGIVGGTTPLTSLNTNAAGSTTINGGAVTTTAAQTFADPVTLGANTILGGTAITFGSALNSSGTPRNLTLNNSGSVLFAGPSGNVVPLGALDVAGTAGTTTINGSLAAAGITLANAASINGAVVSAGDISIAGPVAFSAGTIDSVSGNLLAPGALTLGAGSHDISAGGTAGITLGNISGSTASNLTIATSGTATATSGPVAATGAIGSTGSPIGTLEFDSAFAVHLGGDINSVTALFAGPVGSVNGALSVPKSVATISFDAGNLTINTSGINANGNGFEMDQGQKLSVFDKNNVAAGNLTINSGGAPIQIGDLSAMGSITVNTGLATQIITVMVRPPGSVTKSDGSSVTDRGTDIVAGAPGADALVFTGIIKLPTIIPSNVTSTALVQFASPNAQSNLATLHFQTTNASGINVLTANQTGGAAPANFEAIDFVTTGTVLDLASNGVGNPVSSFGAVVSQNLQQFSPEPTNAITGALRDALQELGIYARDLRTDELVEFLIGRALYDDVPYKFNPGPQDTTVASNRLPYSPVLPIVQAYRSLFLKPVLDAGGKPVLDANGKPKMASQETAIKNAFGQSWQLYTKDKAAAATPDGFRAYLETNDAADPKAKAALAYLNQIRDLLNQIKGLGLTDTEFDVSKKVLLAKVRPANIKEADFLTAIMGPSSRKVVASLSKK